MLEKIHLFRIVIRLLKPLLANSGKLIQKFVRFVSEVFSSDTAHIPNSCQILLVKKLVKPQRFGPVMTNRGNSTPSNSFLITSYPG